MDRCDIPGTVFVLPARAEPGQFKERPLRAWANGFETLHPPEAVESRKSKRAIPQKCVRQPAESLAVGIYMPLSARCLAA
jgi:hypothetical protein